MSIVSMVKPIVRRELSDAAKEPTQDQIPPPKPAVNTANAIEQLTRYIPTEIVTFYVAWLGVLSATNATQTSRWFAFGAMLTFTPVAVWLVLAAQQRAHGLAWPLHPRTWPIWRAIAAGTAFTGWAVALPESPFNSLSWYGPAYGPLVILGITLLLGLLGAAFDPIGTSRG